MSSNTCANCGKGEEESRNLKTCTACKLVKYCNRECQIAHRSQHKKECKKRADEALFKQPPPEEDCPICFLCMPHLAQVQVYMACCGKVICDGCIHAVKSRADGASLCPFCRTPAPTSDEEFVEGYKKRMESNDADAMCDMGSFYFRGQYGLSQNYAKALELWRRAGKLGHAGSHNNLGNAYMTGEGTQRDVKKARHYFELAAMAGDVMARHSFGVDEYEAGNKDRALKHFMIAVVGGNKKSLENIKRLYKVGHATNDAYTNALRAYQEYVDEIKSKQRDEAATFEGYEYY